MAKRGGGGESIRRWQIAGAVRWLARRRSVPFDVAEEAVQEALLQLVQLTGGRLPLDLDAWIRRTAERRLIDFERHRVTQVPLSDGSTSREFPMARPDLDSMLAFRLALPFLEQDRRELLLMRLSGWKWLDIAERTGLGEEAARKRFELALRELQRRMGGDPRR